jgi:hypothetical protein
MLFLAALVLAGVSQARASISALTCSDFSNLPLGQTYLVGNTFVLPVAQVTVRPFQAGNGVWTNNGRARVVQRGLAGGAGRELEVNNVNLTFAFGARIKGLTLRFGEYGGNLNMEINGDFRNFKNLADVDGLTIGGVMVSVVGGLGNDRGELKLAGPIQSFTLGGQELWIDDLCRW